MNDAPKPSPATTATAPRRVVVIGGGPAGMTVALLLARAGHRVTLLERGDTLGGLWAARLDADGRYVCENSCKVYQASYHTAPALFRLLGTRWEDHFEPLHDLSRDWLRPFVADSSVMDLCRLAAAFGLYRVGLRDYRDISVSDWLAANAISEPCQAWMRATALGGITGTLRMTMWELFHRLSSNVSSLFHGGGGTLYWNARPPNAPGGFVSRWTVALQRLGVDVRTRTGVAGLVDGPSVLLDDGSIVEADAIFLAVPPRALARLLAASPSRFAAAFSGSLPEVLDASLYEHLGVTWTFDRPLARPLPLGGHNVRAGWHAILVEHRQYSGDLRPPAVTAVVGSVSVATDLRHPRLGTLARDHTPEELARILWEDERLIDPTLPEPLTVAVYGMSDATQIVHHGPLPLQARAEPIFLATNLSGAAPYFTASLESAIQAGAAAAAAFEPAVERLPTGPTRVPFRTTARSTEAGARTVTIPEPS